MKTKVLLAALLLSVTAISAFPASADVVYDADVNNDGTVSIADSIYFNRYMLGTMYVSNPSVFDVNGNYVIDAADNACILAQITESTFECEYVALSYVEVTD